MTELVRVFQGAGKTYMESSAKEVLLDSGARTGKTFSGMGKADLVLNTYDNARCLFTMETRVSMNATVLADWEDFYCQDGHPARCGEAKKEHRSLYGPYPGTNATLDIIGLNDPKALKGGQWDRIWLFQGERAVEIAWNMLITRMSCSNTPYVQATLDVNPDREIHWANRRGDEWVCRAQELDTGVKCAERFSTRVEKCTSCGAPVRKAMHRIYFDLTDNPKWYDATTGEWHEEGVEYRATINLLGGVQRLRLVDHLWVRSEGLVWPEYDAGRHRVDTVSQAEDRHRRKETAAGWELAFDGFVGGFDWGFRDAGCFQLWGMVDNRRYRLREYYWTQKLLEAFVEIIARCHGRWPMDVIWVSHERPDICKAINDRLASNRLSSDPIARQTEWAGAAGIDAVREGFQPIHGGLPLTYLCREAHEWGYDPALRAKALPTCWEGEISSLSWPEELEGKAPLSSKRKEAWDPACEDHASDVASWIHSFLCHTGPMGPDPGAHQFEAGSLGQQLNHEDVIQRISNRRF